MTRIHLIVVAAFFALLTGCGGSSNQGAVHGKVTFDGKPVERGSILFLPTDGTPGASVGGPITDGQYQLSAVKGPAVGLNRVEIRVPRKTGRLVPKGLGGTGEKIEEETESVASRFNSGSTLTIDIKREDNVGNFDVNSK